MPLPEKRLRIGLTMREVHAAGHAEVRDALAADWASFLQRVLPEALWMPVPNAGQDAARLVEGWRLNGLILTGGEHLGAAPRRDATERALLAWFGSRGLPVLGVCRGMQLLWAEAGGTLRPVAGHTAIRHEVQACGDLEGVVITGQRREVNSYHAWGLEAGSTRAYRPLWRSTDGEMEGMHGVQGRTAAVMWHPEREAEPDPCDRELVRWLFGAGG
jgi:N5-(cytidine 5'-diphosphoramidyl)-L-glutamine hydrolase